MKNAITERDLNPRPLSHKPLSTRQQRSASSTLNYDIKITWPSYHYEKSISFENVI